MVKSKEQFTFDFFSEELEDIADKNRKLSRQLVRLLLETNDTAIAMLQQQSKNIRYSVQGYLEELDVPNNERQMVFNAGYVSALVDIMQLYTEEIHVHKEIFKVNTKYRDDVLRILADRGPMLHRDLAVALKISASGLTAVIKQLNGTDVKLVNVEVFSKYKLYSITPRAYKYIKNRNSGKKVFRVNDAAVKKNTCFTDENKTDVISRELLRIIQEREEDSKEKLQLFFEEEEMDHRKKYQKPVKRFKYENKEVVYGKRFSVPGRNYQKLG